MNHAPKFAALRERYKAAVTPRDAFDIELASRYGHNYSRTWLSRPDEKKLTRLQAAVDRASSALFALLQAISPRDWSYGVPCHWLYEELTYEDAIRPVSEPLSVIPPLAYGATHPRT